MAPQPDWPPMGHVWTQAFIGICFVGMCGVLFDLSRKFYFPEMGNDSGKGQSTPSRSGNSHSPGASQSSTINSRGMRVKGKKKPISSLYKITTLLCISTFACAVLIDFGDGVYYFVSGIDVFHTKDYWAVVLTNVFLGIATTSHYIFIFGRLYKTFKESESKYHLSKPTVILVVTLIALNAMATLFYTTCIGLIFDYIAIGTFYLYLDASFKTLLAVDFTLNFVVLILFLYKLNQIVLSFDQYNQLDVEQAENDEVELNEHQKKVVTVMTRHAILSSIAMLFNMAFYISVIHGSNLPTLPEADLWFMAYSNLIKALYGLTIAVTLYLNFRFNVQKYVRLCKVCHFCCYGMFARCAKDKIQKKNENTGQGDDEEAGVALTIQPVSAN